MLINGRGKVGIENLKNPKAFIYYSQRTDDVYENLEDNNLVFNDMIANIEYNKKLSPKVTELFLIGRKLNISLVLISQSYFKVPKLYN